MKTTHRFVIAVLVAGSFPLAAQTPSPASVSGALAVPQVRLMAPEALLEREQDGDSRTLLVLDVRTPQEFAAGHVPGAVNLPHDQIQARLGEIADARDRDVIVYCRSGRRADLALDFLGMHGFRKLWHLRGDYLAWEAADRPVAREPAAGGTSPSLAHP